MNTRMSNIAPDVAQVNRLEREVERERHERMRHDEERSGLAAEDDFRNKDVREHIGIVHRRRPPGR